MRRQEYKYFIAREDVNLIISLLKPLMYLDSHCKDTKPYTITSIYFDSFKDEDLFEKLDGIRFREKYRVRYYNNDIGNAKFEVKRKIENTIEKVSIDLNAEERIGILSGDYSSLKKHADFEYIGYRMDFKNYAPKAVIIYDRLAFTLPFDSVRITLDLNIRSTGFYDLHIESSCLAGKLVMPTGYEVLEVKFSGELPDYLSRLMSSYSLSRSSISKYTLGRFYNSPELNGDRPFLPF